MNASPTLDLQGLWVPIVTPFRPDGGVDDESLVRLGRRLLDDGAAGLVPLGTTGEPATLSAAERRHVVEVCADVSRNAGRALIAGAGTNSTDGTIAEIDALVSAAGIDAALVVVPYYTRPSPAAIVEHFRIVADHSPVPVVAYNVPYRTGRGLGADEILELAAHENIVGVKQAVGCLDTDTLEVLRRQPDGFSVLAGDDAFIAPTLLMGGAGAIAAAAHVCTAVFADLVESALAGDCARSRDLAGRVLPVVVAGFAEPNPSVWKGALHRLGDIRTDLLRRPMTSAAPVSVDRLLAAVRGERSGSSHLSPEGLGQRPLSHGAARCDGVENTSRIIGTNSSSGRSS